MRLFTRLLIVIAVPAFAGSAFAQGGGESPFPQRAKAAPFPEGLDWLNTARPITLPELRGKFVLLDFWTYCCINCMHILPELKKLEQAYPQELVVVGIHSAKFQGEQDTENIREAVVRYQIEHPVVNDPTLSIWNYYQVPAWPTLVLIDPEGYVIWGNSGETTFERLDEVLRKAVRFYDRQKLIDRTPLRFDLEAAKLPATPLRFPGKVLADQAGGRLFIADSNHNRIVIARLDGTCLATVGSGRIGVQDGDFASAEFNNPQGMALAGEMLYVADTQNHLLRKIDLAEKRVQTIAGTGKQARQPAELGVPARPLRTPLASPWDVCIHEGDLFIAMAGMHQIWKMPLDLSGIGPYAGNGAEDIVDGPLLPRRVRQEGYAAFAQPSGLACDGTWLYVADSEGSSIRAVPLDPRQNVQTVVGTAHLPRARLFTFGDVDGQGPQVRFQHLLGVALYGERLYVADTYNNKIKMVDPATARVTTVAGTGASGASDAPGLFDEPGGLSAAGGKLYVADTNNHAIRVIDLDGEYRVSTLTLTDLEPPAPLAASR